MAVNATKLNKNLLFITENEEQWKQETWAETKPLDGDTPPKAGECGTAFCLAGWAVVNEGIGLKWEKIPVRENPETGKTMYQWYAHYTADGDLISSKALDILGLDNDEMFRGGNSLARLWHLGEQATGGKIQRPASVPPGNGVNHTDDDYSDEYDEDEYGCECDDCVDSRW